MWQDDAGVLEEAELADSFFEDSGQPEPNEPTSELMAEQRAQMFKNRLRKNVRRLAPWARQRGLCAYRLYDSDIPEVRLIVERYADYLVLWDYLRRADRQESSAAHDGASPSPARARFLSEVLTALTQECGVPRERIICKTRRRQRTASAGQYERSEFSGGRVELLITEGGHRFYVNLSDYLDTGLFLDHRETRALVGKLSSGKRVLNLFGYTGSFTVYAAGGGATSSVTVDLSATYLDWAKRNFLVNGMDLGRHRIERADALAFLRAPHAAQEHGEFDLIVLDPPTFSNSKRMRGTLDVDRDHPWLIGQALGRLRKNHAGKLQPGCALLFSCNHRRFKLRTGDLPLNLGAFEIRDLTQETLPRDFHDPRTRCCYLIRPA
jgi:23S rRNA G2069 N7-methylase RlmK/C1962 C5-methylase RlmI